MDCDLQDIETQTRMEYRHTSFYYSFLCSYVWPLLSQGRTGWQTRRHTLRPCVSMSLHPSDRSKRQRRKQTFVTMEAFVSFFATGNA